MTTGCAVPYHDPSTHTVSTVFAVGVPNGGKVAGQMDHMVQAVSTRIGQLEILLDYAKRVEQVHGAPEDRKEWTRNMIKTLSDIAEDADQMAVLLSANAVHYKVLPVTDVAAAAHVSRNAIYKRVAAFFDPAE